MAALVCGAVVVGIDPHYPDALLDELVSTLGLTGLLVDDWKTFKRLSEATRRRLKLVVFLRDDAQARESGFSTLTQWRAQTAGAPVWNSLAQPAGAALVAFSSGSTGKPKPLTYSHAQVVYACRSILELYPELSAGTRLVCWLPLANLFQRMINFCATAKGAVSYVVEDPRRVMEVVPIAKPEVFVAVPRFCEKLHAGMMQTIAARPLTSRVVKAAIAVASAAREGTALSTPHAPLQRVAAVVADRLVLARIRAVMGSNLKFIVSGSAPMPLWLLQRFVALGLPVLEAYGTSENLVPIAANRLKQQKAGTVGKPAGDNTVRIAADGEVHVRGQGVFLPGLAENATRSDALTKDGYLATGDLGFFDDDGFLTLRGRRTESFKNAQGRWVSVTQIEAALARVVEVEYAAVLRTPRERLIGVLTLHPENAGNPIVRAMDAPAVEARRGPALRQHLADVTATLAPEMCPIAFLVVCAGFSPMTGELTTNFKLRHHAIQEKLAGPLESLALESNATAAHVPRDLIVRFV